MDFTYKITIKGAKNEQEAQEAMKSLTRLIKNVSYADLELLSKKIEAKPSIVQTAKTYL